MQKEIKINGEKFFYTLRQQSNSRRVSLSVYPGGELKVSAPKIVSIAKIESFLHEHAAWIKSKREKLKDEVPVLSVAARRKEFLLYKKQAKKIVEEKLEKFNKHYGFTYHRITIRNQSTRWGSCSKNGNLNFNYRIALLPDEVADYLVVHELCHLKEFNHSKKFWDLVSETIPDYKKLRKELKNVA